MQPFTTFTSSMVAVPIENIDTDQIIPARFLKVTDKAGLGDALFCDWRYEADGRTPKADFVLNQPAAQTAKVLVAGHNFGCGSSREHAPWALQGYGFQAVISTYFADIFRNNALKNGLLPIQVDAATHQQLLSLIEEDPGCTISVNLEQQAIILPDGRAVKFPIDGFARRCLLQGVDQLGYLADLTRGIEDYEASHSDRVNTTALLNN